MYFLKGLTPYTLLLILNLDYVSNKTTMNNYYIKHCDLLHYTQNIVSKKHYPFGVESMHLYIKTSHTQPERE